MDRVHISYSYVGDRWVAQVNDRFMDTHAQETEHLMYNVAEGIEDYPAPWTTGRFVH